MEKITNYIFKSLGVSSHTNKKRANLDFYATDPKALEKFLVHFTSLHKNVWEPACGKGHLVKVLEKHGHNVRQSDIKQRYNHAVFNFLDYHVGFDGDILTNPPFSQAQEFIEHSLDLVSNGRYVVMFAKIQLLEGINRYNSLYNKGKNPKFVYVFSERITCNHEEDLDKKFAGGTMCYAWFVWQKGYTGETVLRWI